MNYILMAQPAEGAESNPLGMFLPLIAILVIFWVFMIRPQAKRQKELRKFRESIQKGDKVITNGGIYGKVAGLKDNAVILQVDENTKLTVDKNSIIKDPSDLQQAQK
ncbi:preprotein translocase subunit YajC [Roseimarinus sediminis]|jgi:preprotein translocase subunit YajC|uniref:preprotein translocase subunit YajC n=1 Tax=Roseimarinus sediminis TaxID=1610899 RepID=UPI003D24F092